MILSTSRNFIFIKTRKTAGTSLEIALGSFCSDEDVVTPISPDDEIVRFRRTGVLPRNFLIDTSGEAVYRRAIVALSESEVRSERQLWGTRRFTKHMAAAKLRDRIAPEVWEACFKFAFDRHPYEKAVSAAAYRNSGDGAGFQTALEAVIAERTVRNWDLYSSGEEILLDTIFRYEDMGSACETIENRLRLERGSLILPHTKHTFRNSRKPAAEMLSPLQREKIYEICAVEFEAFGYER